MTTQDINTVSAALNSSWSSDSSTKWKPSNPALGQCGVTALVANDLLGGEIVKTWVVKPGVCELWHFYNVIDGQAIDFTISQFDEAIHYDDEPSSRDEAFQDATPQQYESLKSRVKNYLYDA